MYKRYSHSYRAPRRQGRRSEGGGWKAFCVLGTLVGIALMCNFFFPAEIQALRERLTSGWAEIDYRAAFSAIGRAVGGEEKPSEALAEVRDNFSGQQSPDAAVAAGTENAKPAPSAVEGSREAALEQLRRGVILPETVQPEPDTAVEANPDSADSIITFDYAEIITDGAAEAVTAYDDGIVIADGESSLYGKYLIIIHGGVTAQYFHCTELKVRSGDEVTKGQIIGYAEPAAAENM